MHEIAHAEGITYNSHSRPEAELIIENVAYIICASAGLDTSGKSIPYLVS